jgi:PAS domain S-box-containing protein
MSKRIRIVGQGAAALAGRLAALGYVTGDDAADLVLADAAARDEASAVAPGLPVVVVAEGPAEVGAVAPDFSDRELALTLEMALCRDASARAVRDLESFFAVSSDLFCFLDFGGYFRRLNPAWERTLGFTREELMSRRFIEFVHPDDRERTVAQNGAVRGGDNALGFENRYLCKDGSYRWLLWNSSPVDSAGVIYGVARDITARKLAEDERARLLAELQTTLAELKTLREILPICAYCRKIRDDQDYWSTVESYIARHTNTQFSHGICPHCMETVVEPQLAALERK